MNLEDEKIFIRKSSNSLFFRKAGILHQQDLRPAHHGRYAFFMGITRNNFETDNSGFK
jgi:hypothetical protein